MNAFVKFLWALFAVNALYIVYNVYKKNSHTNQAHSFDNFWISIMSTKPEASAINEEKRFSNKSENLDDGMGDELSYKFFASTIQCSDDELTQFPGSVIKQKAKNYLSDQSVLQRTKECSNYFTKVDTHGFSQVTKEEEETPIAFSIKVHREIGILEMFMALYFRPSDAYCIHVDAKASREVFATVNGIVNCYNHMFPKAAVFMPRQSVPVFWGTGGSILEADWICYREFHELGNQWKYLTSVVGTELPLVSIQRLRYVLNKHKGNVVVINEKNRNTDRQLQFWEIQRTGPNVRDIKMERKSSVQLNQVPCGLKMYKGVNGAALTSTFVDFVLSNPFTLHMYNWLATTSNPEEHFISTLGTLTVVKSDKPMEWRVIQRFDEGIMNFKGTMMTNSSWLSDSTSCYKEYLYSSQANKCRFIQESCKLFNFKDHSVTDEWTHGVCFRGALWDYNKCAGKNVRTVCNLGLKDLPVIKKKKCMIANKFGLDIDITAVWCQYKEIKEWTLNYNPDQPQNGL